MEKRDKNLQHSCLNEAEIGAFLQRDLEGPRFLECVEHIAQCDTCRERLALRQDLAAAESRLEQELSPFVDHTSEDEVQKYVSGKLGLTRIREIDAHIARCAQCAEEIRDLRDFVVVSQPVSGFFFSRRFMIPAAVALTALAIAFVSLRRPRDVVSLNDGSGRITLDERGTLKGVGSLDSGERNTVRETLVQQRLSFPASLRAIREESGTLMGATEPAPLQLKSPIGTVVQSDRPTLSWTSDPQSTGYIVTVRDQNNGQIITSPRMQSTAWTVLPELERSHTYVWQVLSSRNNGQQVIAPRPPAAAAKFIVLDETTNSKLQHLPASHLARAVLYANAGLLDDVSFELAALREANPQSQLVRSLSEQLQQVRGNE
jgi:hypothetical protein